MAGDPLTDSRITRLIEIALLEDAAMGDPTTESIVGERDVSQGEFLCKADGIVAGLDVAGLVLRHCDESVSFVPAVRDGMEVRRGSSLAAVHGPTRALLLGERTALNFLQRMSGIATLTRRYVDAVAGTRARITDTRKTAPGLRVLDKLAVRAGGGVNHRFGLDDMVLIKDNHVAAAGGVARAVATCRRYLDACGLKLRVEVETKTLEEVREVMAAGGVDRIMFDNFSVEVLRSAVQLVGGRVETEASGGITLATAREIAETGVDYISVGALTHSVTALDISLELSPHV